ncbi:MAG: DUF4433 domain-containing protein [Planctomycetaceae bacterium]|nr:DUF4433 domain-containing protein [Planctomycetaceae bacterium]
MEARHIYHITHVDNLPSILQHGRLWSDAQRIAKRLTTTNIGHSHIKARRLRRRVAVAARGMLGDYVPFNFCPRSVMLYVIHRDSVEGYDGGQEPIIHLVSSVGVAIATGRPWAFTDRHAELGYARYFDSIDREAQVDWSVMPRNYWAESDEMKEKRQAEFLVHEWFPFDAVEQIGVVNERMRSRVQKILATSVFSPPVIVERSWYY